VLPPVGVGPRHQHDAGAAGGPTSSCASASLALSRSLNFIVVGRLASATASPSSERRGRRAHRAGGPAAVAAHRALVR
jgi:hypothetical protein